MIRALAVAIVAALVVVALPAFADSPASDIGVRYSTAPDKVRVVLDLPRETTYTDQSTPSAPTIAIPIPLPAALPAVAVDDPIVTGITVVPDAAGQAQLTISLAKARKCHIFTLPAEDGKPFRLVVDVLKQFSTEERQTLSPAISYTRTETQTDDRYSVTHLIDIDANDSHVHLGVAIAAGERERVAAMASRTGAVCGVNGSYFVESTRPVGLVKSAGQIISMPIWGRTAIAFPKNGPPVFGNPSGMWHLTLPDGTTRDLPDYLDAFVLTPPPASTVINGHTLAQVPANPNGLTVVVRDGKIVARGTAVSSLTPADLAVRFSADDAKAVDAALTVGASLDVTPVITPDWSANVDAVGAGPRLVRDGAVQITSQAERFKPDIVAGRAARTAIGVTRRGHVLLLVVEAPCPYGGGATLEELAAALKAYGAVDAMNCDGGGSSTLGIAGVTVNVPSKAWVRPVASGIMVFDDRVPAMPAPTTPPAPLTTPAAAGTPSSPTQPVPSKPTDSNILGF